MIKLGKHICFGRVTDETLICNSENEKMIKLNKSGTELWELLFAQEHIEDVIDFYVKKFPNDKEKVIHDIKHFYNNLIELGVIDNELYQKI